MMNTTLAEIQGLETEIANSEELIARKEMAIKLSNNYEFRKLILEEFCVNEAARLVHASADPALTQEQRADSLSMAQAAGHLRRYLSMMIQMASVAERELPEKKAELERLRAIPEDEQEYI